MKSRNKKIKIRALEKVAKAKIGYLNKDSVKPETKEEDTFNYLTLFGFNIELIRPTSTKKAKNPDIFIAGVIWEVKTPISSNKNTIKNRFREASKQSSRIIFDLRHIRRGADEAKKQIVELFGNSGRVRNLMIIEENGDVFDFYK